MRRALWISAVLALMACAGEGGEEGGPDHNKKRQILDPRTLVEVQVTAVGEVVDQLLANGAVESEAQANLVPEASGRVVSILVEEGDRVSKGQTLAVIENASLESSLEQARSNLTNAEDELTRARDLHKAGAISDAELSTAEYNLSLARARLEEARKLEGRTRLVSPIAGTVAVRDLQYGEVAGGTRAFQIVDMDRLIVEVRLPERDLPRLKVGQKATLSPVYDPDTQVDATLVRVSPTVDSSTGTVRATVAIPKGQALLRPGQFVSVRLELDRHSEVLVVPRRALLYEEGEPVVFRVAVEEPPPPEEDKDAKEEGEGKKGGFSLSFGGEPEGMGEEEPELEIPGPYRVARRVPVTLGLSDEDNAELLSGLAPGDEVVITGQASLRDGARVRYADDPAPVLPEEDEDKKEEAAKAEGAGETEG